MLGVAGFGSCMPVLFLGKVLRCQMIIFQHKDQYSWDVPSDFSLTSASISKATVSYLSAPFLLHSFAQCNQYLSGDWFFSS
jgi:hypothetical protein